MQSTQFIVKPSLDRKGYRLKCRFKIEPGASRDRINYEKVRVAERFVEDMRKQGWDYANQGFTLTGPFPFVEPMTLRTPRTLTAREMAPMVAQGARFRDEGGSIAPFMPALGVSDWWEYELAGVFSRPALMTEYPDAHEVDL